MFWFYESRLIFVFVYSVLLYLFSGYSLYEIAKRNNVKNAFVAWIPIVQYYVIGSIAEEYVIFGVRIKHLSLTMCALAFIQIFCGYFPMFGLSILGFAAKLAIALVMHKFFYLFEPKYALIFSVLCIFGRLPFAILLFLIREKPMQMSAGAYPYPFATKM